MAEIRLEGVKKYFRDIPVIKGIDLIIGDGEFFTFVGPSGCGKSTLLNMVAGLETATEGKIFFDGLAVNDLPPGERDVAMVFQSYALYPHMTVYGNIAFPLRVRKKAKKTIDEEVRRIAILLGLGEMLDRRPSELSGGQRQRVALGRAIIRRPKVFLMDEPLSNLDARLRVGMRAELKKLHQELKITTVYVTHDQAEALSLSERIAVLHEGEIRQCGTPAEVYRRPADTFVAGFIGSPPMNFIPEGNLLLGIRPEEVSISPEKSDDAIEVTVSFIESAGPFNWVDVRWKEVTIKGKAGPETALRSGGKAFMTFSEEKVLRFDATTGRAIDG